MNIVLVAPEIPPNTGNVARLCAATHAKLHLIEPLGFRLDDRELKRAGMDYWQHVEWHMYASWKEFKRKVGGASVPRQNPEGRRAEAAPTFWFTTGAGKLLYTDVRYRENDYLVFGRESVGLPEELLRENEASTIRIPMWNENARSLNLSNAVAIILYQALRQVRTF